MLLHILFASISCCQCFGILHSTQKLCLGRSPVESVCVCVSLHTVNLKHCFKSHFMPEQFLYFITKLPLVMRTRETKSQFTINAVSLNLFCLYSYHHKRMLTCKRLLCCLHYRIFSSFCHKAKQMLERISSGNRAPLNPLSWLHGTACATGVFLPWEAQVSFLLWQHSK